MGGRTSTLQLAALLALPILFGVATQSDAQTRRAFTEVDDNIGGLFAGDVTGAPGTGRVPIGNQPLDDRAVYAIDPRSNPNTPSQILAPGMGMGLWRMISALGDLNLNLEQREKAARLRRELRDQHMKLMNEMWDETNAMEKLYAFGNPDPGKVGNVYERVFVMQRELVEISVAFRRKLMSILNEEQRAKLKGFGPNWMTE